MNTNKTNSKKDWFEDGNIVVEIEGQQQNTKTIYMLNEIDKK